jgi:hypothetical protein
MLPSMVPPPMNRDAGSETVMLILPCRGLRLSRNSRGGTVRINVFEGDPLNLHTRLHLVARHFAQVQSDRPLDGII